MCEASGGEAPLSCTQLACLAAPGSSWSQVHLLQLVQLQPHASSCAMAECMLQARR